MMNKFLYVPSSDDSKIKYIMQHAPGHTQQGWKHCKQMAIKYKLQMFEASNAHKILLNPLESTLATRVMERVNKYKIDLTLHNN